MLAGLDVGGTHTDAVLVEAASGRCLAAVKTRTRPDSVLPGIREALGALFAEDRADPARVRRLTVSTTLGLNALLTGNTLPVGMLVVPGPGVDIRLFWGDDPLFRVLPGAQDHRGRVIAAPDAASLRSALEAFKEHGARAIGIVSKFSPKNPELEQTLAAQARDLSGPASLPDLPLVLGSQTSGSLNFPRRVHTVWCNAALAAASADFITSLTAAAKEIGLRCPLAVLKADAGSFSAREAAADPASTMGSGPAASLLGVWALTGKDRGADSVSIPDNADLLMIDVGGTSTDLALLSNGHPLLSREGLLAAGRPTLIRTLWTRSLALGGDSSLRFSQGNPSVGPDRSGPALALDNDAPSFSRPPTLTDALNVLGLARLGDTARSLVGLDALARHPECPEHAAGSARAVARLFLDAALRRLREEIRLLVADVNSQPVYTIRELLVDRPLDPTAVVLIGGPAQALAPELESVLGLPVLAPEESAWANALGAALARPTKTAELYADTLLGRMNIPDFGLEKPIGGGYDLSQARADMLDAFAEEAGSNDAPPEDAAPVQIVYAESFALLEDNHRRGKIIRIQAQREAGLSLPSAREGAR